MADEKDAEQRAKALAWLNAKTRPPACPFCRTNEWALGATVNLFTYDREGLTIGGPTVPAVTVFCKNCGHMALFSAVIMKLTEDAAATAPAQDPPSTEVADAK
jgi:hypothetical protein